MTQSNISWPDHLRRLLDHANAVLQQGDRAAARGLVADLIDANAVKSFGRLHHNARLLVAGHDMDANQLPLAFAEAVRDITGLTLDMGLVKKANEAKHTGKGSLWRLLDRPKLEGRAKTGATYILVDDVITQGGTISELRQHVMRQGCRVVGVAALAHAMSERFGDGIHIAQQPETRMALTKKFGEEALCGLLVEAGIYEGNFSALTDSEAKAMLYYKNIEALRRAVAEERARILASRSTAEAVAPKGVGRPFVAAARPADSENFVFNDSQREWRGKGRSGRFY
jgi:ribosomal protein S18